MSKYALISVSDKTGIELLALELEKLDYTIVSTSNTAKYLGEQGVKVLQVSELTGFPEIMDGRVKTLHPVIHAGILADRENREHLATLREHGINQIDLVAVNLYPFAQASQKAGAGYGEIIENIDIGGPTLIRAAAKNNRQVVVLVDPADYLPTLELLKQESRLPQDYAAYLAGKAFAHTRDYDAMIAAWFSGNNGQQPVPPRLELSLPLTSVLRYGENPHQQAGFYQLPTPGWEVLHGMAMSFNNTLDLDAALKVIRLFQEPTVVIIKHTNPCGIGSGETLAEAYHKAFATDTESPYGGIVVVNRSLDADTARIINGVFTEIIIAPDYSPEAMEFLVKKKNRRLIRYDAELIGAASTGLEIKTVQGGYLAQQWDGISDGKDAWQVVTTIHPDPDTFKALSYGYRAVAALKSNAIAIAREDRVLGMGSGQTSRVDACHIAMWRAQKYGLELKGAILASDGFIPFRDTIEEAARHGIVAIIQPGGSKGDSECIAACNELGISMVFTGFRHFRH